VTDYCRKSISVRIVDDEAYQKNKSFFVELGQPKLVGGLYDIESGWTAVNGAYCLWAQFLGKCTHIELFFHSFHLSLLACLTWLLTNCSMYFVHLFAATITELFKLILTLISESCACMIYAEHCVSSVCSLSEIKQLWGVILSASALILRNYGMARTVQWFFEFLGFSQFECLTLNMFGLNTPNTIPRSPHNTNNQILTTFSDRKFRQTFPFLLYHC